MSLGRGAQLANPAATLLHAGRMVAGLAGLVHPEKPQNIADTT